MDFKTATLYKKTILTEDTYEFKFKTDLPFTYETAQFVTIKVPSTDGKMLMRSYSISCSPTQDYFELCVKLLPEGKGSFYLRNLAEGQKIEFLGPSGRFKFESPKTIEDAEKKTVFLIATGTGIAPIKAMIEDELAKGSIQRMHLIFGVRYIKDVFYREVFEKLAIKHSNFTFDITVSRPEETVSIPESQSWNMKKGRVTDILKELNIDPLHTEAYICGLKEMIEETNTILLKKRLPEGAIHFERFN